MSCISQLRPHCLVCVYRSRPHAPYVLAPSSLYSVLSDSQEILEYNIVFCALTLSFQSYFSDTEPSEACFRSLHVMRCYDDDESIPLDVSIEFNSVISLIAITAICQQ